MLLRTISATAAIALTTTLMATMAAPAHAADRDCGDFASQAAAQHFFLANGGPGSDPHGLDADRNGIACESNPAPYYYGTSPGGGGGGGSTGGGGGGTSTPPKPQPKPVIRQWARVIKVTDGDTIKVRLAGGPRKNVRIVGIDTPEVYGGVECGGREASKSMKRMLPRRTRVLLISDPSQQAVDRYGRLLRYVHKKGKLDVGRRQVFKGHARVYVYRGKPFRRTSLYRKVERSAKNNDRGWWGSCR